MPVDSQMSLAQLGYRGGFDDFGPVRHSVSADGLTVTNVAMKGHRFYPGYVELSVFAHGGTVYIRTVDEGIGAYPDWNEIFAKPLWDGLVNSHIRYRVGLGYRQ